MPIFLVIVIVIVNSPTLDIDNKVDTVYTVCVIESRKVGKPVNGGPKFSYHVYP